MLSASLSSSLTSNSVGRERVRTGGREREREFHHALVVTFVFVIEPIYLIRRGRAAREIRVTTFSVNSSGEMNRATFL